MVKKGVILLFLSLLMYHNVGYIINFQFVLAEWQHDMRTFLSEKIDKTDLIQFTFHKSDFQINTAEFTKEDKLFDVVKTIQKGDSILVYCYQDDFETQLTAEFNALLFQSTTTKGDFKKKMSRVLKQLADDYVPEKLSLCLKLPPSVFEVKNRIICPQTSYFSSAFRDILTPPPQPIG